jgi:arylsulfatase A-like enzyme
VNRFHLSAAVLVVLAVAAARATADEARPNVLFIVSDDLNCRIGCYGDPVAKTPNLDRLAGMGVRFDRAYCQFPVCNPSRSSVMSGRYPTTTGVLDLDTWLTLGAGQETMNDYFATHGYAVEQYGKIYHGSKQEGYQGLRNDEPLPSRSGANMNRHTAEERARQQADEPGYWNRHHSPYRNMAPERPERYAWANKMGPLPPDKPCHDTAVADDAIRAMQNLAGGGRPFFLAVGFHLPHVPLKAPRKFFDMFDPARMPLPVDFAMEPQGPAGTPPDELRANLDLFTARRFSEQEAREAIRAYYACMAAMDVELGRVLDEVERLGLARNTIVVLWSDHGWHLGEKGMWAKGTTFEVSARGPLLVADPRQPTAGRTCRRVVQYLDIYPTLVDLCGLPSAAWLEGASLRPLLADPEAAWDRPAFTVQTRNWSLGRSVRTERWRYTEWDEGRRGRMLFDHDADPHEQRNLADEPGHEAIMAELRQRFGDMRGREP